MKKNYLKPEVQTLDFYPEKMIAISAGTGEGGDNSGIGDGEHNSGFGSQKKERSYGKDMWD